MTLDEIKVLDLDGVEARCEAIKTEMTAEDADMEKLSAEITALEERKAEIIAERKANMEAVKNGDGKEIEKRSEEKTMMTLSEIRSSEVYLNAYAEYLKTNDDTEVRSVLTENGVTSSGPSAGVPLPTYAEDRIRTAWDNDDIMSRVRKTFIKGILKVGFELSATDAAVHAEGANAPTEEVLNLGIVTLVPETLKKWITISDEALEMKGQAFIDYIFDEIEYRIVKKAADTVVADIVAAPTTATKTAAAVSNLTITAASLHDIVDAIATLSDEAANPVIIINKASYAAYKGLQMAANYGVDPFDGMPVIFNNTLAATSAASGNIAIVGDLEGYQANFPNGYGVGFKYDDLSLAEKDLVKVVGRMPWAHGVTASGRFCVIKKGS